METQPNKRLIKRAARAKEPLIAGHSLRLSISHHRHTGHVLPRAHTSYPFLAMIVLCVGVLLFGMTRVVVADDVYGSGTDSYVVRASVPGPAPTQAAAITSPLPNDRFNEIPVTVEGTCPVDTYVNLYRNAVFSGTGLCTAEGTFSIETDLFAGANELLAQVFSPTDVPGPASTTVTVYYDKPVILPPNEPGTPPAPTAGGAPNTPSAPAVAMPLLINSAFKYKGYYVGQTVTWRFSVEGGVAPYAIVIDWGDGTQKVISRAASGTFTVQHTYTKAGGYKGNYVIKVRVSDGEGQSASLQLITIINDRPGGAIGTTVEGDNSTLNTQPITGALKYLWPSYGVVVLMLLSFWLGERREYRFLKSRHRLKHS